MNKVIVDVFVFVLMKVEIFNLGYFIKDWMVLKMLEDVEVFGKLKLGGIIIECILGNMGMGFVIVGCVKGYCFIFIISDK